MNKKMNNLFKSKFSQEEMVGFVLIVVLVSIIAVVFLGISLSDNSSNSAQKSFELSSFLTALTEYTTECEKPETEYKSMEELIVMCSERELCAEDVNSCSLLSETLSEILENSFVVEDGSFVKYYKLDAFYGENLSVTGDNYIIEQIWKSQTNETEICPGIKHYNYKSFRSSDFDEKITLMLEKCELNS